MKVILVNLPYNCSEKYETEYYPLGLLILQNAFIKHGIETEIIDLNILSKERVINLDKDFYISTARFVYEKMPNYIGITSMSNNFINAILLAEEIKKHLPNSRIFMGGPQVSYIAKEILENYSFIDFVCKKECELILEDLCKYFVGEIELGNISNVAYRKENAVIENRNIGRLLPEDEIPSIEYTNYFNQYKNYFSNRKIDLINIEGGRGCPYNCIYCSTNEYWDKSFRFKSIDKIINEMKCLNKQFGIKKFNINHDLFTCNKGKLIEFCNKVKDMGVTWTCSSRTDVLDEDIISILKASGCTHIFFGIETGDAVTQKYINKNLDLDYADKIIKYCKDSKINTTTSFIIGFPDETIQSINNTLEKIIRYKIYGCDRYLLNVLIPEHGSALIKQDYKLCFEESLYSDNWNTVSINREKEINLIKNNPYLFNSFYYYESTNFNSFFLETMKNLFLTLIQYFKYTLYLYTTYYKTNIVDVFFRIMKWEFNSHLSEDEYQISKNTDLLYKNICEFISNNCSDNILKNIFKYERDILDTINKPRTQPSTTEFDELINLDAAVFKYNYNIAKIMYLIQSNERINLDSEDLFILMKSAETKDLKMKISIINKDVYHYLSGKTDVSNVSLIEFLKKQELEPLQMIKELIKRGFLVGNTSSVREYIESRLNSSI